MCCTACDIAALTNDVCMVFVIARGYITKEGIDKTVWSVRFFDFVAEEVSSATGLCHLMWKGAWGAYQDPNTVVMSSRKMRAYSS